MRSLALRRRIPQLAPALSSPATSSSSCSSLLLLMAAVRINNFASSSSSSSSSTPLSQVDILKQRWKCTVDDVVAKKNNKSGERGGGAAISSSASLSSSSASATTPTVRGGFFGSALRNIVNQVTRRDDNDNIIDDEKKAGGDGEQRSSSSSSRSSSEIAEAEQSFGGIKWNIFERLDIAVRFTAPAEWTVNTRVSENFVGIQCVPSSLSLTSKNSSSTSSTEQPQSQSSPIHGLSVSTFAYHTKVPPTVSSADLMRSFLAQFHRSVGRTSVVVGSSALSEEQITSDESRASVDMCKAIVRRCGGGGGANTSEKDGSNNNNSLKQTTVCELMFRPPQTEGKVVARALCKTFFHRSRRRHTVVVFAVPDEEWEAVKAHVQHAVVSVEEMMSQGGDGLAEG